MCIRDSKFIDKDIPAFSKPVNLGDGKEELEYDITVSYTHLDGYKRQDKRYEQLINSHFATEHKEYLSYLKDENPAVTAPRLSVTPGPYLFQRASRRPRRRRAWV